MLNFAPRAVATGQYSRLGNERCGKLVGFKWLYGGHTAPGFDVETSAVIMLV